MEEKNPYFVPQKKINKLMFECIDLFFVFHFCVGSALDLLSCVPVLNIFLNIETRSDLL